MTATNFQNTKLFSFEDLKASSISTKEQYIAIESHKQLISSHKPAWISLVFRILMIAILSQGVPLYMVALWATISIIAFKWHTNLSKRYAEITAVKPRAMTQQMKKIASEFKFVYQLNCIIWAGAIVLAQFWLADLPRVLALSVLTAVLYLSLSRNCSHVTVMNRVSLIILGLPFLAGLFRYIMYLNDQQSLYLFLGLTFYLGLNGCLVWMVGYRFNRMFLQRCESEYANMLLIESLEKSQEKLHVEQVALIEANSVIQQFYSAAAHDLRQPVYAMEIYTDMLREDPSKLQTLLPKISLSCTSINAMFNDLFDFQQKHLGDTKIEIARVNIEDTLKSLALHFEPIAASKGLGINFKAIHGYVDTIPLYLVRILSNLIANAITYTPTGRILVAARKSGEYLCFEIWDTGPGIDKAAQGKIFDEFYKINNDKKTSNLGLGLAIVKELVRRLEGSKIRVNSVMGRGTVFKLYLPIQAYSKPDPSESCMHYSI
jgi:signal transduction histidine kinase